MISCCFFEGSCFVLTLYVGFSGLSYVTFGCVLFSKIKLFLVWVCLSTFLCFL